MCPARRELAEVLRDARALLALPGNDFCWSSWEDAAAALSEVDVLITELESGRLPDRLTVQVLFAATGPVGEVALSSGWAELYLRVAERCDNAVTAVYDR